MLILQALILKINNMEKYDIVIIGSGPGGYVSACLLYTSPSPRDRTRSRMPSSA